MSIPVSYGMPRSLNNCEKKTLAQIPDGGRATVTPDEEVFIHNRRFIVKMSDQVSCDVIYRLICHDKDTAVRPTVT